MFYYFNKQNHKYYIGTIQEIKDIQLTNCLVVYLTYDYNREIQKPELFVREGVIKTHTYPRNYDSSKYRANCLRHIIKTLTSVTYNNILIVFDNDKMCNAGITVGLLAMALNEKKIDINEFIHMTKPNNFTTDCLYMGLSKIFPQAKYKDRLHDICGKFYRSQHTNSHCYNHL